ncbi:hypothetical protein OG349_11040 [Streptomyces sp. NBC_01317]|uniref:hypothetical protein n=1 Tax=Streptomyces sp. NBC_01317 TaxID=2903822 RepID=UPI002E0DF7AF|nr:hypothetical protein OG349_11040 [Streptomyces sp. NBC_01317]
MAAKGFRIKISADERSSLTVMFEPSGMSYELSRSEVIFASLEGDLAEEMEIVYWPGGISIWPPGPVVISDVEGRELHRLY